MPEFDGSPDYPTQLDVTLNLNRSRTLSALGVHQHRLGDEVERYAGSGQGLISIKSQTACMICVTDENL